MRPILEALRPLYPFGLLFVITTLWVWYSRNQILDLEPRIMFVLFGTIFSNISVRNHTRTYGVPKAHLRSDTVNCFFISVSSDRSPNVRYSNWCVECIDVATVLRCIYVLRTCGRTARICPHNSAHRTVDGLHVDDICNFCTYSLRTWNSKYKFHPANF